MITNEIALKSCIFHSQSPFVAFCLVLQHFLTNEYYKRVNINVLLAKLSVKISLCVGWVELGVVSCLY